ncbi:MAG: PEP-CTERM sorting domain-containing protein [Methylococcaceae bacterium]|nr:PEP-CTERM sorting domain-containing protein [Methylococcaceae bacterium]
MKKTRFILGSIIAISGSAQALPVYQIPNLASITFYETSGGVNSFTFAVNSTALTTQLPGTLGLSNNDFGGVSTEFYDVYYSNSDGTFNLNGEYLSIEGSYGRESPAGGGLNLAEIALNFSSNPTQYGNIVASFVALGNNAIPSSVGNAIDGNIQTATTMGNTVGQSQKLRVTLGFLPSSGPVPEPSTLLLLSIGAVEITGVRVNLNNWG